MRSTQLGQLILSGAVALTTVVALELTGSKAAGAAGDLDEAFSRDGVARTLASDRVADLRAGVEGSLVVVGTASADRGDVLVARYRADGEPDPSFSEDGVATFDLGADDAGNGAYVAPDGAVVVAGEADGRFLALRLTPQGLLDPAFSDDGVMIRSDLEGASAVSGTETGSSIFASGVEVEGEVRPAAVQLRPDGTLDPAFGTDGVAVYAPTEVAAAEVIEVLADGSALVGAEGWIAKLTSTGHVDQDFGESGSTFPQFGYGVTEILERAGGDFLAAFRQSSLSIGSSTPARNYVVRFSAAGESLGSGGHDLGSVVAAGSFGPVFVSDGAVSFGRRSRLPLTTTVRALSDEFKVDESFGPNGSAPLYPRRVEAGYPVAMTVDSGGRPVVATPVGRDRYSLLRLQTGGGPPDADADGLANERDRCLLGFSSNPSGCSSTGRSVEIRRAERGSRAFVLVRSSTRLCLYGATIELVHVSRGADRVVARKDVNVSDRRLTPFSAAAGPGRYYARVPKTKNAVVRCTGARSGTIRLRRTAPSDARALE